MTFGVQRRLIDQSELFDVRYNPFLSEQIKFSSHSDIFQLCCQYRRTDKIIKHIFIQFLYEYLFQQKYIAPRYFYLIRKKSMITVCHSEANTRDKNTRDDKFQIYHPIVKLSHNHLYCTVRKSFLILYSVHCSLQGKILFH